MKTRVMENAKGDRYQVSGDRTGYEVRIWNAHYRAWMESRHSFRTQREAIAFAKERIAEYA